MLEERASARANFAGNKKSCPSRRAGMSLLVFSSWAVRLKRPAIIKNVRAAIPFPRARKAANFTFAVSVTTFIHGKSHSRPSRFAAIGFSHHRGFRLGADKVFSLSAKKDSWQLVYTILSVKEALWANVSQSKAAVARAEQVIE
jgi:hypothetical protein